jgi:hypothetical protein
MALVYRPPRIQPRRLQLRCRRPLLVRRGLQPDDRLLRAAGGIM